MARLGMAGAETGVGADVVPIDGFGGDVAIVSSPVRAGTGAYAMPAVPGASNYVTAGWTAVADRWYYVRCWFRMTQLPPSGQSHPLAQTRSLGGSLVDTIYVLDTGRLSLQTPGAATS